MTPRNPETPETPDSFDTAELPRIGEQGTEPTSGTSLVVPPTTNGCGDGRVSRGRWSLIPARHDLSSALNHLVSTASQRTGAAYRWVRSTLADAGPRGHRVHPKARAVQIGTAAAAMGVLGVVVGGVQQPQQGTPLAEGPAVQEAAEVSKLAPMAPMAAPAADHHARSRDGGHHKRSIPVGIEAWIAEATSILQKNGYHADLMNIDDIRTIIDHESAGNPRATNDWDSNAEAGTPSKGLMQTIDPTFDAYALPGHDDIWNPVDNIIAATRYSIDRYGSISNVPGIVGKHTGGGYEGY